MSSGESDNSFGEKYSAKNQQAECLITSGKIPEAAAILVDLIEKDGTNWRAYNNLGIICWSRKERRDAFIMFKKSIAQRPDYVDALMNVLDASLKLKKTKEIMPLIDAAFQCNPSLKDIQAIRDSILNLGDDLYRCDRAFMIGSYSPLVDEAEKALKAGERIKTMNLFLQSNDQEGANAPAFCGLGIIAFYRYEYRDAFQLFVESIKVNPTDQDTFLNMLDAAKECGKTAQARKIFDLCRKEYPLLEKILPDFDKAG